MIWLWVTLLVFVVITLVSAFGKPTLPTLPSGIATSTKSWFGANWKFLVVVVGLGLWGKSCYSNSKIQSEVQAKAIIAEQNKPKPEIRLLAHPDRISEPAMIWEKFGSEANYVVIRRGNVLAFEDGKKSNPLLLTPNNMEVPIRAKWHIAFKSAESGPVEVIIRKL